MLDCWCGFYGGGWQAEFFFEAAAEMGGVLEAAVKGCFADCFVCYCQQLFGVLQSFFEQPLTGCGVELFFKIPFEGGEAAVAQFGVLFQPEVKTEIVLHYPLQGCGLGFM